MCSIIGYCGRPADLTAFHAAFARTVSRGPDDSRVIDVGQGILGFHRLSIMGLHPEGMPVSYTHLTLPTNSRV